MTRGINGGTHGLADRIAKTEAALSALAGKLSVAEQQRLLAGAGFDPGPIDGLSGKQTRRALQAAKKSLGLEPPELWERLRRKG